MRGHSRMLYTRSADRPSNLQRGPIRTNCSHHSDRVQSPADSNLWIPRTCPTTRAPCQGCGILQDRWDSLSELAAKKTMPPRVCPLPEAVFPVEKFERAFVRSRVP